MFQHIPITNTKPENAIDLPGRILQLLILAIRVEGVFLLDPAERQSGGALRGDLLVGFQGKDAQVLARDVQTRNGPRPEDVGLVALVERIDHVSPPLIDPRPVGVSAAAGILRFFGGEEGADEGVEGGEDVEPRVGFLLVELDVGVVVQFVAQVGLHRVRVGGALEGVQACGIGRGGLGAESGGQQVAIEGVVRVGEVEEERVHGSTWPTVPRACTR